MPLHRRLFAYALSILENESDAADCIQESLTKLWEQRERLEKISNVEAYALVTVKNLALNMATRQRNVTSSLPDLPPDRPEPTPGPAEALESRERMMAMAEMIRTLPENQRRVILLSAVSGLSNSEIREATGMTDDNVRVLLSRGRRKLRDLFSSWMRKDN